jgi:type II secretory pathway pseudopilin PulG
LGRARTRRDGLAALELVIVVSVLVLLTGVLVPPIDRALRASQCSDALAAMQRLANAMRSYRHDTGAWPAARPMDDTEMVVDTAGDFSCLLANTLDLPRWNGPYLVPADEALIDPWGRPYVVYTFAAGYCHSGGAIALVSFGPNGSPQCTPATILTASAVSDDLVMLVAAHL